ncbi:hypothetical protein L6164_017267 [Bauhinia variegata]|uniref:Uncharacterized protein n=1 Tax=Bauhinia variegata TaxID=167791 RepID=A0ACB9N7C3_BAUVA|nr:hypothetical protein L6164_017267 [Bauhinia variegata]
MGAEGKALLQNHQQPGTGTGTRSMIFTYGTLKRGFSNHTLLQDLVRTGDAAFVGTYRTAQSYPLVCGPYRVPFLLNIPGSGHPVEGEMYAVSSRGLARVDELEGTTRGHYVRLPVKLVEQKEGDGGEKNGVVSGGEDGTALTCAEAYFAHQSYAMELWKKSEKRGFRAYTEKEAKGYVKRKDRPQNLTFLEQIRVFVSSD